MTTETTFGGHGFGDPLEVVDRTEMSYEKRLGILQEWRASLANSNASREKLDEVDGAIRALETGARVQGDGSDEVPAGYEDKQSR